VVNAAQSKAEGVVVAEELRRPHAVIAGWLAEHKERKRRDRLDRNPYSPATPDWTAS